MYTTKVDLPYTPQHGDWHNGNPFTTAFCRTMKHGNVLVTGGLDDAKDYITLHLGPTLAVLRFWHNHHSRGYTTLINCNDFKWGRIVTSQHFVEDRLCPVRTFADALLDEQYNTIAIYHKIPSTFPRALKQLLIKG
jgi:hypothetical protein